MSSAISVHLCDTARLPPLPSEPSRSRACAYLSAPIGRGFHTLPPSPAEALRQFPGALANEKRDDSAIRNPNSLNIVLSDGILEETDVGVGGPSRNLSITACASTKYFPMASGKRKPDLNDELDGHVPCAIHSRQLCRPCDWLSRPLNHSYAEQ